MKASVKHYANFILLPQCGVAGNVNAENIVFDADKVTCGRCIRTNDYRIALWAKRIGDVIPGDTP